MVLTFLNIHSYRSLLCVETPQDWVGAGEWGQGREPTVSDPVRQEVSHEISVLTETRFPLRQFDAVA